MGNTIEYLDPLSIHNMADTIQAQIQGKKVPKYTEISVCFSPEKSVIELDHFVNNVK